jgi:hypothetical protein
MSLVAALTTIVPNILGIIDKAVPDRDAAELAKGRIELELIQAASEINKLQAETNVAEAAHRSIWVAGWRPAIGWCSALGVAYYFVLEPILNWVCAVFGFNPPMPVFPQEALFEMVFAMLGLAGLRSFEKVRGVTR